jgi:hypothetical protein
MLRIAAPVWHPHVAAGRRLLVGLALLALGGTPGCGPKLPATVPVSGSVRLSGKPLAEATVVFVADHAGSPGGKAVATGLTDASGRFTLVTRVGLAGLAEGAVPGTHRVTVSAFGPPKGMSEAEFQRRVEAHHAAEETKGYGAGGELPQRVSLLRPEFSDGQATTLSADVTADGTNEFTFDVQ